TRAAGVFLGVQSRRRLRRRKKEVDMLNSFKSKAPEKDKNATANVAEAIGTMAQPQHSVVEQAATRLKPTTKAGTASSRSEGGTVARESSSRVPSLLACSALGPLASAAQYSCRREPCTGRSAWLLLGRACLSAWIEHRSGEQRSP